MEAIFGKKKRAPGGALVLYTTKHGVTQCFAEQIAQPLDALVKEAAYAKISDAKTYDTIVLGCCVYAFKIKGLDFFANHIEELKDKRLVLYTCGVNDPQLPQVRKSFIKININSLSFRCNHTFNNRFTGIKGILACYNNITRFRITTKSAAQNN